MTLLVLKNNLNRENIMVIDWIVIVLLGLFIGTMSFWLIRSGEIIPPPLTDEQIRQQLLSISDLKESDPELWAMLASNIVGTRVDPPYKPSN